MWWLGSLKVVNNITIGYIAYDFLFVLYTNNASILHQFQEIASYLAKVTNFPTLPAFRAPAGMTSLETHQGRWHQKNYYRFCRLLCIHTYIHKSYLYSAYKFKRVTMRFGRQTSKFSEIV